MELVEKTFRMIPRKAKKLIIEPVGDRFYYAVNPWVGNSMKILNAKQIQVLEQIDGVKSIDTIASETESNSKSVGSFLNTLLERGLLESNLPQMETSIPKKPRTLTFWIHTTNKCNLSCSYCYISTLQTTGPMNIAVRDQLLKKLLETAKMNDLQVIKLKFAGGEPLTQFKIWMDFIEMANDVFAKTTCKLSIVILTNLTILNQQIVTFAKQNHIRFSVSLDGYGKYHDLSRSLKNGKGTFESVDENLTWLKNEGIPFSVSSVISNKNLPGLIDLTKYLISGQIPFRYSVVKGEVIDRDFLSQQLEAAYDLMEKAVETGWRFSEFHQLNDLKPFETGTQTCSSGRNGAAINVDGNVYYCHVQFGSGLGMTGSVFDNTLDLLTMIESGSSFEGSISSDCVQCSYRYICTSGCPVYRVDGKDPNCGLYHRLIPRILNIQAKERLKLILDHHNA